MIGLLLSAWLGFAKPVYTLENTYPRVMEIVDIEEGEDGILGTEDDEAVCEDAVEYLWDFIGPEDLEINDIVVCTMYDNGTQTILDDEIVDVVWSGYVASEFKGGN